MTLGQRWRDVSARIAQAARSAGREPDALTTIVVTKNHPATLVRELAGLGVTDVGENRHQEAAEKAAEVVDLSLRWHFVGQLQTNKVRAVLEYASTVHSVDRVRLVDALGHDGRPVDVFLQVNLTDDTARGGCAPAGVDAVAEAVMAHPTLRLLGVMAVAPLDEDPRSAFARLRGISEAVCRIDPNARAISAGMSHDFEAAIAEGATHLRIGAAITGNRPVER